jgi:sulfate transport system ATP-binding protein
VLLLDEPFGALDAQVRKDLRRWLRRLHDELHITSVFVTHDQEEAMEVSDRVVVMNRGRIEQVGAPSTIYDEPASPFVYEFVGQVNAFPARIANGWADVGGTRIPAAGFADAQDAAAVAYIRPHEIAVAESESGAEGQFAVEVQNCTISGPIMRLETRIALTGEILQIELSRSKSPWRELAPGKRLFARPTNPRLFAAPADQLAGHTTKASRP